MKIQLLAAGCVCFVMAMAGIAFGEGGNGVGVGIMVGEPTGLNLKKWIDANHAVDAGMAWSFSDNASLHLHGDYLFHRFDVFSTQDTRRAVPVHFGAGIRVKWKEGNRGRGRNDGDTLVGARFPVGISYLFPEAPFDVFAEIVPVLDVTPKSDFSLNAAIGVRYYFGR